MATNKEQLIALLDDVNVSDGTLSAVLADNGLTGNDTYSEDARLALRKALVAALYILLTRPSVSEGGYSIRYDADAIKARIGYECKAVGIDNPLSPKVTDATNRW